ncbi:MAG: hypothetical protein GC159_19420 [Phycisphaera sp.]|nr:hypothetical protein [Phycisphaera sp.]
MEPDLEQFCLGLASLELTNVERALGIIWFFDQKDPGYAMSSGAIARIMHDAGLGSPHSTRLGEALKKSGHVNAKSAGFYLKVTSRAALRTKFGTAIDGIMPSVDQRLGYIPEAVWHGTRGYIERVASQINGSYQYCFYDGASVLVRRLVETLIIDAYCHANRADEIRDGDGNYFMLQQLILKACDKNGIGIGRDAKKALHSIKQLGDRSAHNPRYTAVKADLENIQSGVRVVVDELVNLAGFR